MASPPSNQFGKRQPATQPSPSPPVKRSHHVALLLTGAVAVGGTAFAVMPHQRCQPAGPAVAAPSTQTPGTATPSPTTTNCGYSGGGHGGSGGGYWSRSSFYGGSSSTGTSTGSGSTATTRGGFGSFGSLFSGGS